MHEDRWLLYLYGELEGPEREAFESHLASCGACRGELEAARGLLGSLRSLEASAPEAAVRGASARWAPRPGAVGGVRRWTAFWRPLGLGAACAASLFAALWWSGEKKGGQGLNGLEEAIQGLQADLDRLKAEETLAWAKPASFEDELGLIKEGTWRIASQ